MAERPHTASARPKPQPLPDVRSRHMLEPDAVSNNKRVRHTKIGRSAVVDLEEVFVGDQEHHRRIDAGEQRQREVRRLPVAPSGSTKLVRSTSGSV